MVMFLPKLKVKSAVMVSWAKLGQFLVYWKWQVGKKNERFTQT